jgi:hypothetical protein
MRGSVVRTHTCQPELAGSPRWSPRNDEGDICICNSTDRVQRYERWNVGSIPTGCTKKIADGHSVQPGLITQVRPGQYRYLLPMTKKNIDSQVPVLREPDPVPDWIPQSSGAVKIDDLVREIAVMGFDRSLAPKDRMAALKELGKHKGMFIERSESRLVDATQVEVAKEMFKQMTPADRREWLQHHMGKLEAEISIPLHPSSPPDEPPPPSDKTSSTLEELRGR